MSTEVIQYAEHEYDNRFAPSIDLSILLIFRNFCPRVGEDMSTGVIEYAEHEYDNHFAPIWLIFYTGYSVSVRG